jgi:hypothetical protein
VNGQELLLEARSQVDSEKKDRLLCAVKTRLRELDAAKLVVKRMEESLQELVKNADDAVFDK